MSDPGNETATITAKGQITLPKVIRQALGVDYGGKVAFDLQNGRVVVSRAKIDQRFRLFFRYDSTTKIIVLPALLTLA